MIDFFRYLRDGWRGMLASWRASINEIRGDNREDLDGPEQ